MNKACIGPLGVTPLPQPSHAQLRCRQRSFASYTLQPSNKFPSLQKTSDVHVDRSQISAIIIHSITPLWEGIFLYYTGPRRDEVTGEWRRLHNEELSDLYSSPNIVRMIKSRRMRWAGHVARMGEERGVYTVLVGKPKGKRPLGRPRRRWVDNIRMDLQEAGCGYVDWIGLAQDRVGGGRL